MPAQELQRLTVRDADEADLPALTRIKGEGSAAIHRDRLLEARASKEMGLRYLVLVADHELVGFACLVMRRPASWSDAGDMQHLPQIVDLRVQESHRGRGYGSAFIRVIERIAATAGHSHLYVSVEPVHNPRAYALYQRLGYQQLQSEPYWKRWHFTDSAGGVHAGENWVIDMVKSLRGLSTGQLSGAAMRSPDYAQGTSAHRLATGQTPGPPVCTSTTPSPERNEASTVILPPRATRWDHALGVVDLGADSTTRGDGAAMTAAFWPVPCPTSKR
jgi:GNAT superfamily N-acetyltransferase